MDVEILEFCVSADCEKESGKHIRDEGANEKGGFEVRSLVMTFETLSTFGNSPLDGRETWRGSIKLA